jgi:hypothetical protein
MLQDVSAAGVVALFGMVLSFVPPAVAAAYMVRPRERLLAIMRPLSLATIFAALNTLLSGLAAELRIVGATPPGAPYDMPRIMHGLSESITPMFVAFGFLTLAWLFVAVGMRRSA